MRMTVTPRSMPEFSSCPSAEQAASMYPGLLGLDSADPQKYKLGGRTAIMVLGKSLSIAFSLDGELLAALTERSVRILSSADLSTRLTLKIRDPSDVRFSPSGDTFLVKNTSGRISWHAIDGRHSQVIRPDEGEGPAPDFAS